MTIGRGVELRILAALLGYPEQGGVEALRETAQDLPWLAPCLAELEMTSLESWQGEHTRLFVNGAPTPCPPFASVWREQRMHGGAAEELMLYYRSIGLEPEGMPADYLGTMLEVAALLDEQECGASLATDFWQRHLLPWLPRFCSVLGSESGLIIYRDFSRRLEELSDECRVATPASGPA